MKKYTIVQGISGKHYLFWIHKQATKTEHAHLEFVRGFWLEDDAILYGDQLEKQNAKI